MADGSVPAGGAAGRPSDAILEAARRLPAAEERRRFFTTRPELVEEGFLERLCAEAARLTSIEPADAEHAVATCEWLAERLGGARARGLALRARANLKLYSRDYLGALATYERALAEFESAGDELGAAITRSVGMNSLSQLGRAQRALDWAAAARRVLVERGERLRAARLEVNVGLLLARQDRFAEALERFRTAYEELELLGEPRDVGGTLRNLAVCYQDLNEFDTALETYERARSYCREHGLTLLELELDYNIAYLHYMLGDYTRAIREFDAARLSAQRQADPHHQALCDLEQAEIYLELNLVGDAAKLARAAERGFTALGMEYEAAKAIVYRAVATGRQGRAEEGLELFDRAAERFEAQDNAVWLAVTRLGKGQILAQTGRSEEAIAAALEAQSGFAAADVPARIVASELLLARVSAAAGRYGEARRWVDQALARLETVAVPALELRAQLIAGEVEEAMGDPTAALASLRRAEALLERLRGGLITDELRIAFSRDKQAVHEGLVALLAPRARSGEELAAVFETIEKAKSRALIDLMAFRPDGLAPAAETRGAGSEEVVALRRELRWHYRSLHREELRGSARRLERTERLMGSIRRVEGRLRRCQRRLRLAGADPRALERAPLAGLDGVRAVLPPASRLLEYFVARGDVWACIAGPDSLVIEPVARLADVDGLQRHLRFLLGKFRFGPEHVQAIAPMIEQRTLDALGRLFDALVGPIRGHLEAEHLVVVPHGPLHRVPFHALWDGERFLVDACSISYAPSATVFALCSTQQRDPEDRALVLGVADEMAPRIAEEARMVAALLPASRLLLGEEATRRALEELGERCRILHLATHGHFRADNPMFSAIQLGDSRLSLFDLYDLRLHAELVVLSGCGTGLSAVEGSDELVGLTRGLLHAGARSLVATLWDVNDESTGRFMRLFYDRLLAGAPPEKALRGAQLDLRREFPHPYYWAPFLLVGRVGALLAPAR